MRMISILVFISLFGYFDFYLSRRDTMYSSICSTCQHEIIIKIKNDVDIWCEPSLYSPLNLNNMIEFIPEKEPTAVLSFGDVEDNQFFVSLGGALYQKHSCEIAHCIADNDKKPYCGRTTFGVTETIAKILPFVKQIKF